MKTIYIVASHIPTKMGKMIRFVTRFYYNHISFSFHADLSDLVSFARYYYEVPLYGGFVHESIQRFTKGKVIIFECEVSEENYENIQNFIQKIKNNDSAYRYHLFNALLSPLQMKIYIENSYTCEEFVSKILKLSCIIELDKNYSIQSICNELNSKCIYEGSIENYANQLISDRQYFKKIKQSEKYKLTYDSFNLLLKRMVQKKVSSN